MWWVCICSHVHVCMLAHVCKWVRVFESTQVKVTGSFGEFSTTIPSNFTFVVPTYKYSILRCLLLSACENQSWRVPLLSHLSCFYLGKRGLDLGTCSCDLQCQSMDCAIFPSSVFPPCAMTLGIIWFGPHVLGTNFTWILKVWDFR